MYDTMYSRQEFAEASHVTQVFCASVSHFWHTDMKK